MPARVSYDPALTLHALVEIAQVAVAANKERPGRPPSPDAVESPSPHPTNEDTWANVVPRPLD